LFNAKGLTHHNHRGRVFTFRRKRALERKIATKHPPRRGKTDANPAKRIANPGGGMIIAKTEKTSSSTS
jgi:hypothetical protein